MPHTPCFVLRIGTRVFFCWLNRARAVCDGFALFLIRTNWFGWGFGSPTGNSPLE
jgi:hypothetical protein